MGGGDHREKWTQVGSPGIPGMPIFLPSPAPFFLMTSSICWALNTNRALPFTFYKQEVQAQLLAQLHRMEWLDRKKGPLNLWLIPTWCSQPVPSVPSWHNGLDLTHIPFNSLVSLFLDTFPNQVFVVVMTRIPSISPISDAFSRLPFIPEHQRDPVARQGKLVP